MKFALNPLVIISVLFLSTALATPSPKPDLTGKCMIPVHLLLAADAKTIGILDDHLEVRQL